MKKRYANLLAIILSGLLLSSCVTVGEQQPEKTKKVAGEILTISAVGDVMLGGTATPELEKYGYDYPFKRTKIFFNNSDIVFANLEGPLTVRGEPIVEKKYMFRAPPEKVAPALKRAGIDIVSLANNHTMDYGEQGLFDTMAALDSNGITYAGAGRNIFHARKPAILNINNNKVAFLAYSLTFPEEFWADKTTIGTAFGHEGYVRHDIEQASKISDLVIVSFHWGREVTTKLRPYQINLGHAAIDAGAMVVLGHHPHILQAVERYKQGVILYSLGNYVFGSYSKKAKRSAIAQFVFTNKRLTALQLIPINVNNVEVIFQPSLLEKKEASQVILELKILSGRRSTTIQEKNGIAVVLLTDE